MSNSRITKKERALLKGAIRRVFSRSELRLRVMAKAEITHSDSSRPRVKKWIRCETCNQPAAKYECAVDHILPVIPLDKSFEEMSLEEVVDNMWCLEDNLQAICPSCHDEKTKVERKIRTTNKKSKRSKK